MAIRRWLLGAGVALAAAPATLCVGVAPARAEQPVVRATVYAAGHGPPRTVTVTDTELAACPPSGSAPLTLQPGGQPFQPAAGSSWSLGTVVACGLNIQRAAVTAVAVDTANRGFETALPTADVFDPTRYHDLNAPAALPVVSLDGGSGQVSYARPLRGHGDRNGFDHVAGSGPVTIAVYEKAPPLVVHIVPSRLSSPAGTVRDRFTAQVTDPGGHTVPASTLSAAWTFGDETGSAALAPVHTFGTGGVYFVTVTVADAAAGTGGTRTISVAVDAKALRGDRNQGGAGGNRKAKSRSGTVHGSGASPQGSPHAPRDQTVTNPSAAPTPSSTSTPGATPTPSAAPSPTPPATPTPPAIATPAPGAAPTPVRPHPRPGRAFTHRSRSPVRRRTTRAATARRPATRLVTGQLVAALEPVPAASSPLARPAAAVTPSAAVGAATHTTTVAGWVAVLVVAALLGAGAAGERRGRGRWGRLHRPPERS